MWINQKLNIKKNIIVLGSIILISGCSALAPAGGEAMKYLGFAKGAADAVT